MKRAPPSGTLYTAAKPAPPPQATSSRSWAVDRPVHRPTTLPNAAPTSFGAASRPSDTPIPMTTIESTEVPRLRRNPSSPSPRQTASSTSVRPGTYRRSRYQATPPNAPATTSDVTRRTAEACSAPSSNVPLS